MPWPTSSRRPSCCSQSSRTMSNSWTDSLPNKGDTMRTTSGLLWLAVFWLGLVTAVQAQTLPFGISLPPSLNFATSPSPIGSGARAAGKANAFIAVADDATAASHNPGALLQLQDPEFAIVGSFFVRSDIQDVTRPATMVEDQTLSNFDLNYLSV